jgi:hypothetical protein
LTLFKLTAAAAVAIRQDPHRKLINPVDDRIASNLQLKFTNFPTPHVCTFSESPAPLKNNKEQVYFLFGGAFTFSTATVGWYSPFLAKPAVYLSAVAFVF